MFRAEIGKIPEFSSENFQFLEMKFSLYLYRRVFIMVVSTHSMLSWRNKKIKNKKVSFKKIIVEGKHCKLLYNLTFRATNRFAVIDLYMCKRK